MSHVCRICSREFEIPADAVVLRQRFGIAMYRFPMDGQVHEFRVLPHRTPAPVHKPAATPDPVEQTELLNEVLNILTELLPPALELPKPKSIMDEEQLDSDSPGTMAAAFNRLFEK